MSAVEQLENGVRVHCADGFVAICQPLTLKDAKKIMALWNKRFADRPAVADPENPTDAERTALTRHFIDVAAARLEVVKIFSERYTELDDHISPGDVEQLVPDFFWSATGASVPAAAAAESAPTGTASTASTAPPGASSPTL